MSTKPNNNARKRFDYSLKNTPLKAGDIVDLLIDGEVWDTTKVVTPLSKQFVVRVNKRDRFYFYEDKGLTWQRKTNS